MTRTVDLIETANLVRKHLKATFPGVKFSVRTERYSMGCAIAVRYNDATVSTRAVDIELAQFQGSEFSVLSDCFVPRYGTLNGERVHYGVSHILAYNAAQIAA